MASIEQLISDVELRIYGGKPSDDAEIEREQIRFWLETINKALVTDYINKTNEIPSDLIRKIDCLVVHKETTDCDGCNSSQYIELPKNSDGTTLDILSLRSDGGIVDLKKGNSPIYRLSSPSQIRINNNLRFANNNAYYYRVDNKIYLFNGIYPSYCKLSLFVATVDTTDKKDNEQFPTVDALMATILDEATRIGMNELKGKQDIQNDGTDN
jgi:hypothetical protein